MFRAHRSLGRRRDFADLVFAKLFIVLPKPYCTPPCTPFPCLQRCRLRSSCINPNAKFGGFPNRSKGISGSLEVCLGLSFSNTHQSTVASYAHLNLTCDVMEPELPKRVLRTHNWPLPQAQQIRQKHHASVLRPKKDPFLEF